MNTDNRVFFKVVQEKRQKVTGSTEQGFELKHDDFRGMRTLSAIGKTSHYKFRTILLTSYQIMISVMNTYNLAQVYKKLIAEYQLKPAQRDWPDSAVIESIAEYWGGHVHPPN